MKRILQKMGITAMLAIPTGMMIPLELWHEHPFMLLAVFTSGFICNDLWDMS